MRESEIIRTEIKDYRHSEALETSLQAELLLDIRDQLRELNGHFDALVSLIGVSLPIRVVELPQTVPTPEPIPSPKIEQNKPSKKR